MLDDDCSYACDVLCFLFLLKDLILKDFRAYILLEQWIFSCKMAYEKRINI